jgi:hypothetical protein
MLGAAVSKGAVTKIAIIIFTLATMASSSAAADTRFMLCFGGGRHDRMPHRPDPGECQFGQEDPRTERSDLEIPVEADRNGLVGQIGSPG